ncbi:MAG TPA: hypothetical protein VH540_14360 [Ktedonobacterales bacterium]|jgi:hypothetical protein
MSSRLADRLSAARQRRFVGRESERSLFQSAITVPELPFHVLHVFGPGGIGKSTLIREFAAMCQHSQLPIVFLDARYIDPSPDSFINALWQNMNLEPGVSPLHALGSHAGRQVILIDTYEALTPLEDWLCQTFLPQLPDDTLIVLSGRQPPSLVWRTDPGWQTVISSLPLRNLKPGESRTYLAKREVPAEQHQNILSFTHGHPLALSLVADLLAQRRDATFKPEEALDVVKTLLEQLVQKVPGPAHRAALEACSLVRLMTEGLLAEMLGMPDAHEVFEWLRGLSCIEAGAKGVFPHDLAREALATDLRWRNPDWYAELHQRARTYYSTRLQQTRGAEQQSILIDYIYLHRDNLILRPYFEWQEGGLLADTPHDSDWPLLIEMVEKHEGQEAAQIATHWFARQPQGVLVIRDAEHTPAGFMLLLALHQTSPEDREPDPGAQAAWRYLQTQAPLRSGEVATLFRFWMARDTYQQVSPVQSLLFVHGLRHYLTTPGLAFSFFPCSDPEFWFIGFAYGDLARIPAADFAIAGRSYGVYGHDWRAVPPAAWLALLAERETALVPQPASPPQAAPPLIVLSQPEFEAAVHQALRNYSRAEALRDSPLLRSRMVTERAGINASTTERANALQALLKEVTQALQSAPREAKLYRALYHTFIQPAPTQEQASELLDVPFSTYRRHLKEGIARVVALLWQKELEGTGA